MSKITIILGGGRALMAGQVVELLETSAVIDGETYLCFRAGMDTAEVDALPEPWMPGAYLFANGVFTLDANSDAWRAHLGQLDALKTELSDQIDKAVADVYSRWLRFDAEYVAREAAAREYLANGTISDWVTGFATPAGLPLQQAATLIVQQADALHLALKQLGALRMRKYEVKAAPTASDAIACERGILAQIAEVAAGLQ